jgi:hypothetical protein
MAMAGCRRLPRILKGWLSHLDPALRAALDERAAEEHRPAAEVVREALRRYRAAS